jgi:hypothetical protein
MATSTTSLASRLATLRDRAFVGRDAELALLEHALCGDERPFALLYVYGPGGIGKSVLLREFARVAEAAGGTVAMLDARDIDLSPPGFLHALGRALDLDDGASPIEMIQRQDRPVLVIDTYELLTPLDAWLRDDLLPQLPSDALVIVGARIPPRPAWRADPAWSQLMHVLPLRNLQPKDSRAYLQARAVPEVHHAAVLDFTHGHPLALSLLADMLAHSAAEGPFRPDQAPDVVRSLLQRFVEHVPSRAHWQALAVCAHARVTNEDLLCDVLGPDAAPLFTWLRDLPFIEHSPLGIFPHDLAREVLEADLRWRDPSTYEDLHNRVRIALVGRIPGRQALQQQAAYFDLMYLVRHSSFARPFYDWTTFGHLYAEHAVPEDYADIVAMVRRHEGEASACIAEYWLERQPRAFIAFRGAGERVAGFAAILLLETVSDEDRQMDPAIASAWEFCARHGPLRPGERLIHHRYFVGREQYQDHATHNRVAMVATMHWLTTPRLAWCFAATADPEHWRPMFEAIRFPRAEDADFTVGGHRYGLFVHDWRIDPPLVWVEAKVALEPIAASPAPASAPLIVLSEPDFANAVRQALRDFHRPQLAHNPLLSSRLARSNAVGAADISTLQALLRGAADELRSHPRDAKLQRCLVSTFLDPIGTQEQVAEALGLPFNTYRYQLSAAIARVADSLWQRELSAAVS